MLLSLTVYDYPDGLLTSHEFEEIPAGKQRDYDIEEFRKVLDVQLEALMKPDACLDSVKGPE